VVVVRHAIRLERGAAFGQPEVPLGIISPAAAERNGCRGWWAALVPWRSSSAEATWMVPRRSVGMGEPFTARYGAAGVRDALAARNASFPPARSPAAKASVDNALSDPVPGRARRSACSHRRSWIRRRSGG